MKISLYFRGFPLWVKELKAVHPRRALIAILYIMELLSGERKLEEKRLNL